MIRAAVATLAILLACGARAQARTEFCPAEVLYSPAVAADAAGRSASAVFSLYSESPRTIVSATIVADTDGGWYTWDVANLPLTGTIPQVRSELLVADFPKAVFVRHAWIIHVRTAGDAFGWQTLGEVSCGIPSFGVPVAGPQKPLPVGGLQHVKATPIAPLYSTECPHPFAPAILKHAARLYYPSFAAQDQWFSAQIAVAVGQNDAIADAWVYKSSGNVAMDKNALSAALASSYASAISYCQKAEGIYLFRADFNPS
jgi:hypothetical protein